MQIETKQIIGDVSVSDTLTLQGKVAGTITVLHGGHLVMNGMVTKNVMVDPGGVATINGTVLGNVINNGGSVEIFGSVKGQVHDLAGRTAVCVSALIGPNV